MLKFSESEQLVKELFVKASGDEGFNDTIVFESIQCVMGNGKITRTHRRVFVDKLGYAGQELAISFCEMYCSGGLWKAMLVFK